MSHMNIVKFHVKQDSVEEFLNIFKEATLSPGQISAKLVQIFKNLNERHSAVHTCIIFSYNQGYFSMRTRFI